MTVEIGLVLSLLAVSIVFLVTEWIPMEATALLMLGALATSGLLTPTEALAGFSNPAVVTVWAVFILSGSLTRVGVANVIGQSVLRLAGRGEVLLTAAIMVTAGVMSAFMNNVAVAALMLPVVMDISRKTDYSPSRLLMPLAYGTLLGGLTTLIGTPPNILASDALRDAGYTAFTLFDYTPAGVMIMGAGIVFMVFLGRRLVSRDAVRKEASPKQRPDLKQSYRLENRLFLLNLGTDSILIGKSLEKIRIRSRLGLNVVAIVRNGRRTLAPPPSEQLQVRDLLILEGQTDRIAEIAFWGQMVEADEGSALQKLANPSLSILEARLAQNSSLTGMCLNEINFRSRFGANVLAIKIGTNTTLSSFHDIALPPGAVLLVQGGAKLRDSLEETTDFDHIHDVSLTTLSETYSFAERLFTLKVPNNASYPGKVLQSMRLGAALDFRILAIERGGAIGRMPGPEDEIKGGDRLILHGSIANMDIIRAMSGLKAIVDASPANLPELESDEVGFMEAILSPHTTLTGKTLRQLQFREKYELTVLAIWRGGEAIRTGLRDVRLQFGDALLLHGERKRFSLLGRDPDFVVLTETAQDVPRTEKIWVAIGVFACVIMSVVLGLLPIHIAAVIGAALVVVTGCLTMEEAYRFIEWKAVFLIAGMLPLGTALDKTGAARLIAEGVVSSAGGFGPLAVMGGIVAVTFLATCFVPTAALVVIMAPIVMTASADMSMTPHALMMAMALAASASFMTPVSHPANILVMGPGGYRFIDYIKTGLPLTLLVFAIIMLAVPFFWPLS